MRGLNVNSVAEVCKGKIIEDGKYDNNICFTGAEIDSRKIQEGNLFIATRGERVDGHSFIPEVFRKGCSAVVCEKLPENIDGPCILVEDSFEALKKIAAYYRSVLDITVVGITGSVGKTSTKEVIASVLAEKFCVLKTEANFNNEVGLPLTILRIRDEHQVAVLEMGINHFGEMNRLSAMARPDICVITNIGPCHLEFLGNLDGVLKAKSEIFHNMKPGGTVCLNGDDEKLRQIKEINGKKPVFYGLGPDCTVSGREIENRGLLGSRGMLTADGKTVPFTVRVPGKHMIQNAVCAAAVGLQFGMTLEEIAAGIGNTESLQGRSRVLQAGNLVIIDDCYNANPLSMKSALSLLETAETRKVAVLGDMFELGENEVSLHREIGEYIAHKKIDCLICIGKLSKNIYEASEDGKLERYYFETKEDFIKEIDSLLQAADTVLFKASNGMHFTALVEFCLHHTWI